MKTYNSKILTTRIETWATPGVPDVCAMDEAGQFHFIELKHLAGNRMNLRPAQVSWLTKHRAGSVWVLARQDVKRTATWKICLFGPDKAVDLALEKFDEVTPDYELTDPDQWPELLDKIFS